MMQDNDLSVAIWNIQGLGGGNKIRAVQNWLRGKGKKVKILALQELKAEEDNLEFNIRRVMERAYTVVDYSSSDRGRTAVIVHLVKINSAWVRGDVTAAWIEVETCIGPITVASIYGPREAGPKGEFLTWLKNRNEGGRWILMSDWNFVTKVVDSVGPTPMLHGSLMRKWRAVDQEWDLLDLRYCAGERQRPLYTRQAKHGDRLDQARLNRVFANDQGLWINTMRRIKHDDRECASDHISVVADLRLAATEQGRRTKRSSYVKMDVDSLQDAEFRAHRLYKKRRDERQQLRSKIGSLKDKIEEARIHLVTNGGSSEEVEAYKRPEEEVKSLEREAGEVAKRRSRINWLHKGDAPTKFYFALSRAKQAAERMNAIITEEGEEITEEDDILTEIHSFYQDLYRRETPPEGSREEESVILATIDKKMGKISKKDVQAVVKLLRKNAEKFRLQNWRTISLLPIAYKIISKLLAERLKILIPKLVDEQTGFVEGRNITDNILCLHLSQELAEKTEQPSLFCKLDFIKAFDRVDHGYLGRTFQAMNFNDHTIGLLQGLVSHGSSKVHIHRRYTRTITLGRGVRQGCNISPLLFALNTQPLMNLLRQEENAGNLSGISIPRGRPLLHRLFANDSGVSVFATEENFRNLTTTISRFESFSGAMLNLTKSVVIPLALPEVPQWLKDTCCKIVESGDHIVYLGCRAGQKLTEEEHRRDLTNKLLEAICRDFLRGTNRDGKARLSLVAWEQVTQRRNHDGLEIPPFKQVSGALKMKFIARLLDGSTSEWAHMIKYFIKSEMQRRAPGSDCRNWTVEEGLILLPTIPCRDSPTTRNILKGWLKIRKHLTLDTQKLEIPLSFSIPQLTCLLQRYYEGDTYNTRVIQAWARRNQITGMAQLWAEGDRWINPRKISKRKGIPVTETQGRKLEIFFTWLTRRRQDLQSCTNANAGDGKARQARGQDGRNQRAFGRTYYTKGQVHTS
ncbi:hypothetical protein R1sor_014319 [Riccia sorocarpa]|uniref:Reverse transcriptase domain-containing protein n=1 Tax=Riccia sorocarpa TaxID=122646 RepID=A0ABD3HCV2_9MARC